MSPLRSVAVASFLLAVLIVASPARGKTGDPLPDVDVSIGKKPSGVVLIEVPNGAPFDSLTLKGSKDFIGSLEVERLPPGWSMTRDGKSVTFSGPAVSGPTRLKLHTERTVDRTVDWDVSLAGHSLARQKNIVPRTFDPAPVKNSLQGVVVMPEQVSPGEAIALQPLPGANLPPGHFVLSGVVTEPLTEEEVATAKNGLDTARPPRGGFVLAGPTGTSCRELLPVAAALVAGGSTDGCAYCKSFYESRSNTANRSPGTAALVGGVPPEATFKSFYESRSNTANRAPRTTVAVAPGPTNAGISTWTVAELRSSHDAAMNSIRNIKALAEVERVAGYIKVLGSYPMAVL